MSCTHDKKSQRCVICLTPGCDPLFHCGCCGEEKRSRVQITPPPRNETFWRCCRFYVRKGFCLKKRVKRHKIEEAMYLRSPRKLNIPIPQGFTGVWVSPYLCDVYIAKDVRIQEGRMSTSRRMRIQEGRMSVIAKDEDTEGRMSTSRMMRIQEGRMSTSQTKKKKKMMRIQTVKSPPPEI